MRRHLIVEYGVSCSLGKARKNNEDNFYIDGKYRTEINSITDEFHCGEFSTNENSMAAVFDGMGGEACGEIASLVAAQTCEKFSVHKNEYEEYLYELANICNEEVLDETQRRSLVLMGTTTCMLQFSDNDVYALNVGDSRIYKLSRRKLTQVSEDHVAFSKNTKAPLTKFLGMPLENESLNPYIVMDTCKAGDVYLLCTDGITDMLSIEQIAKILNQKKSASEISKDFIEMANYFGGIDNSTAIVCKIVKAVK